MHSESADIDRMCARIAAKLDSIEQASRRIQDTVARIRKIFHDTSRPDQDAAGRRDNFPGDAGSYR